MNLDDFRTLLDYHYWARDRVLEAVERLTAEQFTRDMGSSFRSVRDTLAHTLFAEWAWYQRWHGTSPAGPPASFDDYPDVATLRQRWVEHEAKMRTFLDEIGEDGLTRVFHYRLINGDPGSSRFRDMLQHVVNHASYHRGQITTMLRQLGAQPAKPMDLIAFYRLRAASR